jgi:hypothetical protein
VRNATTQLDQEVRTVLTVTVLHYEIDTELHRRIKVAAAQEGETIKAFVIAALEAELERRQKGKR